MTTLRKTLAVLSFWPPSAIVLATWLAWQDRLPAELPTHWSGSGPADSATHAGTFWTVVFAVAVIAALAGTVVTVIRINGTWTQRGIAAALGSTAAFAAAIWVASSASALDVTDPLTVHLGAWILLPFAALSYGLAPLGLLPPGRESAAAGAAAGTVTPLDIEPGETVAWSRTLTSRLFLAVAAVMVVLTGFVVFLVLQDPGSAVLIATLVVMVLSTLLVAAFCGFRVTIDWRGLRVTSMLFGFPLKRIAPGQIATAETAVIEPVQWGGWGYRITPGASAIVTRKGPGLVVTLTDEKRFAITLDNPEVAAGVLSHVAGSKPGP